MGAKAERLTLVLSGAMAKLGVNIRPLLDGTAKKKGVIGMVPFVASLMDHKRITATLADLSENEEELDNILAYTEEVVIPAIRNGGQLEQYQAFVVRKNARRYALPESSSSGADGEREELGGEEHSPESGTPLATADSI